jgi:hypothetical protein
VWRVAVAQPVLAGDPAGAARLRVAVQTVCLRRGKGVLGALLPPKAVEVRRINMTAAARDTYDTLFRSARRVGEYSDGSARCKTLSSPARREGNQV